MKNNKKTNILILAGITYFNVSSSVMHFDLGKVSKSVETFIDSSAFLEEKYMNVVKDMQKAQAELEELQASLIEKDEDNLTEKEKLDFEAKIEEFQQKRAMDLDDINRSAKILEEQKKDSINAALKDNINNATLIEGSLIIYGGEDVTKEIVSSLNNKKANFPKIDNKNIKIGYIDSNYLINNSPDIKRKQEFLEKKSEAMRSRHKELMAKREDKDFDYKKWEAEIISLNNDFKVAQDLVNTQINTAIKKVSAYVAKENNYDLILSKDIVFSGGTDVTKEIIKHYGQSAEDVESKVAYITMERVMSEVNKYKQMQEKSDKNRKNLDEELGQKYKSIQKMIDENTEDDPKKNKEIQEAKEKFGMEQITRVRALQDSLKKDLDKSMLEIKSAAQQIAKNRNKSLAIMDSLQQSTAPFPGEDITDEVIAHING